ESAGPRVVTAQKTTVRIAAIGDLHCPRTPPTVLEPLFAQASDEADVLVLCGDLTDRGTGEEARMFAKVLTTVVKIPIVGVLGNHDYESGAHGEVVAVLADAGMHVLDGEAVEIDGIG